MLIAMLSDQFYLIFVIFYLIGHAVSGQWVRKPTVHEMKISVLYRVIMFHWSVLRTIRYAEFHMT